MGELKAANHIAAGIDMLLTGSEVLVHLNTASGVLDTCTLQVQPFDRRAPPDRHEQRIPFDLLTAVGDDHCRGMLAYSLDVGTEPEAHPLVFKNLAQDFRRLRIGDPQRPIAVLEDRHLGTKSAKKPG